MSLDMLFDNKHIASVDAKCPGVSYSSLKSLVSQLTNVPEVDLYATQNGRPFTSTTSLSSDCCVRWSTKLVGGKGGFGSMLRAIGAQIEKTTNREACRDLSGRRLRDIRQEQRLREWAASRQDREEEQRRRKEERLKRMCAIPSHEFNDPSYEEARRRLEEEGGESLEVGERAAAPATQASQTKLQSKGKKKPKLWIDEDLSDMSSSESGCEEDEEIKRKIPTPPNTSSIKGKGIGKKSQVGVSSTASSHESGSPQSSSDDGIIADGQMTENSNDSDKDHVPSKKDNE